MFFLLYSKGVYSNVDPQVQKQAEPNLQQPNQQGLRGLATCNPTSSCGANGDQYCCMSDPSKYSVCTWNHDLSLYPVTMPLAPGTKCCQSAFANRITQQHIDLPCPTFPDRPTCAAVIESNSIRLGIDAEGSLINCGAGLQYKKFGTWTEVLNYGTLIDAFGASAKIGVGGADFYGGASSAFPGISNLDPATIQFTTETAKTTVKVTGQPLEITHNFKPSTDTDDLYEITVTYKNTHATDSLTDLRYRRVIDFDVPQPVVFDECISIFHTSPKFLEYAHNNPFTSDNDPRNDQSLNSKSGFASCIPGTNNCPQAPGPNMDFGPNDQGAFFNFHFAGVTIPPGGTFEFNIYYGASANKAAADAAVSAVGATTAAYAFNPDGATNSCNNTDGSDPAVFIFAFSEGADPCGLPAGGCVANGDQYCCDGDDSRYNVCTWDNSLNLSPITKPVAPGTKCCQTPYGNRIVLQHPSMACP